MLNLQAVSGERFVDFFLESNSVAMWHYVRWHIVPFCLTTNREGDTLRVRKLLFCINKLNRKFCIVHKKWYNIFIAHFYKKNSLVISLY